MKQKRLKKSIITFVLSVAMVTGAVPLPGVRMVARAATYSNISYIDANGTTKTASTVDVADESLDDNAGSFSSDSGWLYVNNDVTLNGASNTGTVAINLILGDGKTLTLNNAGLRFYYAPLTIYEQSSGTGKLSINGSNASYPMLYLGQNHSLTINSGTVEVTNNQYSYGVYAFGGKSLVMNGGSARFTAKMGTAIYGDVTLNGGTFYASGKEGAVNGTVKVAEGKLYKDDADHCNYYFGTLSNAQKAAINGKTLSPEEGNIYAVAIGDVTRGTVTADKYTVAKDATGEARTVTLTLAPETGYSLKTLTVKDTSGNEVAVSGEGDTRTFTMPNDHVTVSAVFALPTVSTAYIDENGTEQTADAVALTGGGATTLDSGWYVVPENTTVSYTGTLKFNGNTHLILADGATLNCGTKSGRINGNSIEVNNSGLTVYGQRDQTGRLNAYSNDANTIFSQNSAAFNGGTVMADSVGFCAIMSSDSVTVRRGTVNAVSSAGQYTSNHTINAVEGVIVAGGALNVTAPDGMYAVTVPLESTCVTLAGGTLSTTGGTGVVCYSNGSYVPATVKVADGMNYTDGANLYRGTLTDAQKAAIHGETFTPAYGVIAAEGIEHGTVSASPAAFAIRDFAGADKTVTLTVTPDENYTIGTVSYNDGSDHTITPVNGVYSFTMPEKDVTVNATFLKSLSHSDIMIGSIAEQTYQGSGTTPSVTVKDGDTTLIKGEDYTLSYSNNINVSESTAANAPTVTVTGKGNYSGMKTATFTIKARSVGIKAEAQSVELNDEIATGTDKVEVSSGELVSGHSIYRVTVATENTRNAVGTFDGAITASGALIRDANGNDVTANYNITYTAGTLTVTKVKAKVTSVPTAKMGLIYSGESQTLLDANGVADTSMEYALGSDADTAPVSGYNETVPGGTDAKTYNIWYRAKEDENHEAGDPAVLTVEIAKATPNITTVPTAAAITYGQTLNESTLTGGAATLNETDVNGDFTWSDATVVPQVSDSSKTEYTVKFTPNDSVNFNDATCKVKLIVNKAEISGEDITAPAAISDLSYTGSAQELINGGSVTGNTGIMYYAVTTTNTAPADNLYTTSIPTATDAGTYYVWYKVVGDDNHNDTTPANVQAEIGKAVNPALIQSAVSVKKGTSRDLSGLVRNAEGTVSFAKTGNEAGYSLENNTLTLSSYATGTCAISVTVAGNNNYNAKTETIIVTATDKDTQELSFADASIVKTYGDKDFSNAVSGAMTTVNWAVTAGEDVATVNGTTGEVSILKAGTATIMATAAESDNYASATASYQLKVNKATITITAKDQSIYVNGTVTDLSNPTAGTHYTVAGLKTGDALGGTITMSYQKDGEEVVPDPSKTGTYDIIVSGAAVPSGGNYEDAIVYSKGTLTIATKPSSGGGSGGSGGSSGSGGGGATPTPPPAPDPGTEFYTIPVTNETSVSVETKITDGNAAVSEITAKDIEKITGTASGEGKTADTITIDLSGAKQDVDSVELTKDTVETLKKATSDTSNDVSTVTVRMTDAVVELDASALKAIAEQSGGKTVKLAVEKGSEKTTLNETQQKAIGNYKAVTVFEAYFESNGTRIHDLNGGTAKVSVQYDLPEGLLPEFVRMLYLDPNGAIERLLTTYENGWVTGILTHCSEYAIVYDESGTSDDQGIVEIYRLYNPYSGEHFFTGNVLEKDYLITLGWSYEGVTCYAPESSEAPVYRLYNPYSGDHHYTMNKGERDILITLGWNDEGIGLYSSDMKAVPVFRLYNPNALQAGAHHFTSSEIERDILIALGWTDEGIGWYGIE